jgi:very-short-patch-repair endonuclease
MTRTSDPSNPSPGSLSLATLSREGRGLTEQGTEQPSPLAGEGAARRAAGEGLRTLPEVAKEQQARRRAALDAQPKTLSSRLAPEEFAKLQVKRLRLDMTDAEAKLWQQLRGRRFEDYKFRRQVAIGRYIVDFVCFAQRVIVEVDGSQHDASEHDIVRDNWLADEGFRVVRLWNNAVFENMDGCLVTILDALTDPSPGSRSLATLSRKGRGLSEQGTKEPSAVAGEGSGSVLPSPLPFRERVARDSEPGEGK